MPNRKFEHALAQLDSAPDRSTTAATPPASDRLQTGGGFADPKAFLLAVMNDPTVAATHRIAAAQALLPYCHRPAGD